MAGPGPSDGVESAAQAHLTHRIDPALEGEGRQEVVHPLDVKEGQLHLWSVGTARMEKFRVSLQRRAAVTVAGPRGEEGIVQDPFPVQCLLEGGQVCLAFLVQGKVACGCDGFALPAPGRWDNEGG